MTTIPETVARVLDLDAKATPGPWEDRADQDCDGYSYLQRADGEFSADPVGTSYAHADAALIAYYRTAAPALAREVQRLLGLLDALPASWRNLSDERNTARAECERLRAGLAEACDLADLYRAALAVAIHAFDNDNRPNAVTIARGRACREQSPDIARLRALAEVPK